jgi:histidinol-phosphate/aromatic aminotransferase/cobyric acid decarboxylase-like protein
MAMFGLPNHLRITIGRDDEMALVMEAIDRFFASPKIT